MNLSIDSVDNISFKDDIALTEISSTLIHPEPSMGASTCVDVDTGTTFFEPDTSDDDNYYTTGNSDIASDITSDITDNGEKVT